jgi:peptidoglycan hydrolase-like protein with peptidoglycan-binding domain
MVAIVMRLLLAALVVLIGIAPALAQTAASAKPAVKPPAAAKPKPRPAAAPTAPTAATNPAPAAPAPKRAPAANPKAAPAKAAKSAYDSLPFSERMAIQADLAWTGDYNGLVDGDFGERAIAAVKAFQKRSKSKETGVLTPPERVALAAAAKPAQEHAGWRLINDGASGARLGIPLKLAPQTTAGKSGSRWSSAQGQVQIETFRIREPGTSLAALFERQKKEPPDRKVDYSVLRPDFIVLGGMQGLKKFYVRAHIKDGEVRGLTVLYDQATEGIMDPVVVAMSSAFAPFGTDGQAPVPPPRRKVEYATGIVVSSAGHVITDRQATEECQVLIVAGLGNADRIAAEPTTELALLRVNGARDAIPMPLAAETSPGSDLTLVGIADPQAQGGGGAVSAVAVRLGAGNGAARSIEPMPSLGYAGAAALDPQGRPVGMVQVKPPGAVSAGAPPQAVVVPVGAIRKFLQAQQVTPAAGSAGMDAAKAAVVRVICVRS